MISVVSKTVTVQLITENALAVVQRMCTPACSGGFADCGAGTTKRMAWTIAARRHSK